jgi:hypothetical protein
MKRILILFILVTFLAACSGNKGLVRGARPAWLDNPEIRYPGNTYISAVGSGFSRADAEKDAAARLSRIFRTEIQATESMQKRYEELTRGKESFIEDFAASEKNVTLSSRESLINLQYGESYTDNNARVHILAYMNRFETGSIYEEMITANDKQVLYYLEKSQGYSDPLDKYAYSGAAIAIAERKQDFLRQYRIISPEMSSMYEPPYDITDLKNLHIKNARKITFTIDIKGDDAGRVNNILNRLITSEGFQTASDGGYIIMAGSINMNPTDLARADGTVFYRWELNLELKKPDGLTILSLNPSGRSGSISDEEAKSRAYIDIEKSLDKNLLKNINAWFDNIVISGK